MISGNHLSRKLIKEKLNVIIFGWWKNILENHIRKSLQYLIGVNLIWKYYQNSKNIIE